MAKLRSSLTSSMIILPFTVTMLLWLVEVVQPQTRSNGVCYQRVTMYQMAYESEVYYKSFSCGWFRRCRRTLYRPVSVMQLYNSSAFDCCSGYQICGINSTDCCPVCDPPCTNEGNCSRPNVCDCPPGWTGSACQTDVDECNENIHRCDQNCHNANGTYACSCDNGHRLGLDGITCYDIDECAEGTDKCNQSCYNTIGSYSCNCTEPGYRLHSDGTTCEIFSGGPFQVRFSLSTGTEATYSQFVNEKSEEKANALAMAISQQISQTCDCPYLESFIYGHRYFCNGNTAMKTVIYQARFLVIDGTTVEDIWDTIQNWVLTKLFIIIDGQRYQLDTSCSVVIQEVGDTSCNAIELASSADSQVNLLYYYAGGGGGVLLLVLVTVGVIITMCVIKWKMSRKNRRSCTAQMELVQQNPAYCVHQSLQRQGVGGNHFNEEKNQQYQECYESPISSTLDGGGGNIYENKIQQNPESYEVPSSMHNSGGGHNIILYKQRIQPIPECYEVPCSSGETGNSNVYDTVY